MLSKLEPVRDPVLHPMGVRDDNWQATVGILTGIFAKGGGRHPQQPLRRRRGDEAERILPARQPEGGAGHHSANLADIDPADPMGLKVGNWRTSRRRPRPRRWTPPPTGNMQTHFDGVAGAFATCCSCCSTCPAPPPWARLVRETGRQWALFTAAWCNYVAFLCATLFYQLATFAAHPEQSLIWTLGYLLSLGLLWWLGRRHGDLIARRVVTL